MSCLTAFRVFKQALLVGATPGLDQAVQTSPDKSVMLGCTSSSFTNPTDWGRLRDVVLARLVESALYEVSVRSLTALTRSRPGGDRQTRRLRTRSQASSPPPVAQRQLPSSRTSLSKAVIWYTDPLEVSSLVQGTFTPQQSRPCRAYTMRCTQVAVAERIGNGNQLPRLGDRGRSSTECRYCSVSALAPHKRSIR